MFDPEGHWSCVEDMWSDFFSRYSSYIGKEPKMDDSQIIYAIYNTGSYEGDAFVLYHEGNKLFQVNGSHCSCYGLEGQWDPEETTVEELTKQFSRHDANSYGVGRYIWKHKEQILKEAAEIANAD